MITVKPVNTLTPIMPSPYGMTSMMPSPYGIIPSMSAPYDLVKIMIIHEFTKYHVLPLCNDATGDDSVRKQSATQVYDKRQNY